MKKAKKVISVFLATLISLSCSVISFASDEITVTQEMLDKIASPYDSFLANGSVDLIEYVQNEDGSIYYEMRISEDLISAITQTETNEKTILEITEGDITNTLEIYNDNTVVLDGNEVIYDSGEQPVDMPTPYISFEWRESEPYYGSPHMYTKIVAQGYHNVLLEDQISNIAVNALLSILTAGISPFASFIKSISAPLEYVSFIKSTYELTDPHTYAIYMRDIRSEPEAEYIQPGSGYLRWDQIYYYDEDYTDFGYTKTQWGRLAQ